ncbi:MAG: polysaccharide biosynthesis/export family protein [Bacteroidota bacterium]
MTTHQLKYFLLFTVILLLNSCVSHQELLNFNEGAPFPSSPEAIGEIPPLKIQPDDLLSIRVLALDLEAVVPYNIDPPNMANMQIQAGQGARPLFGYLVDNEGYIDFPNLGRIKIAGLTTGEARALLIDKLSEYLVDPTVVVRFLNFRITVLGEANSPGTFLFANERVTILDALGQAGDLSDYANRTNILVIRQQNDQRTTGRINLQETNIFESPYFYLKQNDVIYVEPLNEKTAVVRDQTQRILPWVSVITGLVTLTLAITSFTN